MKNSKSLNIKAYSFLILICFLSISCVSHLGKAKKYFAEGEKFSRLYSTEEAVAFYKKALSEAELEVEKNPSAQAYMLKGMAELNLQKWKQAEDSFLIALSYGFEKGQEWAQQLSLLGLASTLEEFGVEEAVLEIYENILRSSKLRQVTIFAAQKYTDIMLRSALRRSGKEKEKVLSGVLKTVEKLVRKDLSCGFFHYLRSQVLSHLADYEHSFEEAVIARELGLPTEKIWRDNDLQIVFCYKMLKEKLSAEEWSAFLSRYERWVKRWKWKGPETPGWKEDKRHAARD